MLICELPVSLAGRTCADSSAPGPSFDPPLGRPGILTCQEEAGHLSLQRSLQDSKNGGQRRLFDHVHGYGWILLTYGDSSVEDCLSEEARALFVEALKGKCVAVTPEEDYHGEYKEWFSNSLGLDNAVLIRPDFYIFGHAPVQKVNGLVEQLRDMMGA